MSTAIMGLCWPLQGMSPAQKSVLISLADNANDHGVCWPSVAGIAQRTCLSERAVQNAIKWLISARVLSAKERPGTSSVYQITPAAYAPPQEMHPAGNAPHPRTSCTPPPQEMHPTPADAAPKPSLNRHRTTNEPSPPARRAAVDPDEPKPLTVKDLQAEGIDRQVAAEFLALRKQKRARLTEIALEGIKREADKAGISLEKALRTSIERGWQGFRAEWVRDKESIAKTSFDPLAHVYRNRTKQGAADVIDV
ncbi:helix-turn-helix domain-containing protein [Castellaniella ginsengisoli]|uniref:Helix-turn-helix domain-containing protein n=1 Tax=Castellaniella ginsengisoli TaxID=546114 RepID=A0AB39D2U2_9BURK